MAITLDELLGRNQARNSSETTVDRFPSYDDYTASRRVQEPAGYADRPVYNFESRPYTAPRSVESARAYEASRPYEAPRVDEYRNGGYNSFDARPALRREPADYASEATYNGYADYRTDARPVDNANGLYDFTVKDTERPSDNELYDRLSMSSTGAATMQSAQAARASYNEDYVEKYREANGAKAKRRIHLGLKAKLLIAAYVVVIVLISVLIIVNAKPLNNGTATVPSSSSVSAYVQEVDLDAANNSVSSQIQFGYEIR